MFGWLGDGLYVLAERGRSLLLRDMRFRGTHEVPGSRREKVALRPAAEVARAKGKSKKYPAKAPRRVRAQKGATDRSKPFRAANARKFK